MSSPRDLQDPTKTQPIYENDSISRSPSPSLALPPAPTSTLGLPPNLVILATPPTPTSVFPDYLPLHRTFQNHLSIPSRDSVSLDYLTDNSIESLIFLLARVTCSCPSQCVITPPTVTLSLQLLAAATPPLCSTASTLTLALPQPTVQ